MVSRLHLILLAVWLPGRAGKKDKTVVPSGPVLIIMNMNHHNRTSVLLLPHLTLLQEVIAAVALEEEESLFPFLPTSHFLPIHSS